MYGSYNETLLKRLKDTYNRILSTSKLFIVQYSRFQHFSHLKTAQILTFIPETINEPSSQSESKPNQSSGPRRLLAQSHSPRRIPGASQSRRLSAINHSRRLQHRIDVFAHPGAGSRPPGSRGKLLRYGYT